MIDLFQKERTTFLSLILVVQLVFLPILSLFSSSPCQAQAQATKVPRFIKDCIRDCMSVELVGDGSSTSRVKLVLRNNKTGKTSTTEIETVCMSAKTKLPPPGADISRDRGIKYKLGPDAPTSIVSIVLAADKLAEQGKFNALPINPEKRTATIAQLAIWQEIGGTASGDKDSINRENIKADLLKKTRTDPKSLTRKDHEGLNRKVDLICQSVDLTCKTKDEIPQTERRRKKNPQTPTAPDPFDRNAGEPEQLGHENTGWTEKLNTEDSELQKQSEQSKPPKSLIEQKKTEQTAQSGRETQLPHGQSDLVYIPQFTTFECENKDYQTMCLVEDAQIPYPSDGGEETCQVDKPDGPERNDGPTPPTAVTPYNIDDPPKEKCHCVAGRLVIVIGPFDREKAGFSFKDPSPAQEGDVELTQAEMQMYQKSIPKEEITIGATIEWARRLSGNHLHKVAFRADKDSPGSPVLYYPLIVDGDHWKASCVAAGNLGGAEATGKLLAKACPGEECCYFEEVLMLIHGSQTEQKTVFELLPLITAGKPIKKLVYWRCHSTREIKPGEAIYKTLGAMMKPQTCPCGCDAAACVTKDLDCPRNGKCPHGEPTKVITSWIHGGRDVPLGLDPGDADHPFSSPDGSLREITVNADGSMSVAVMDETQGGRQLRPEYRFHKDKKKDVVGRTVRTACTVGTSNIFMCKRLKSSASLIPAPAPGDKKKEVPEADLKKKDTIDKAFKYKGSYSGPTVEKNGCEDKSGCHKEKGL